MNVMAIDRRTFLAGAALTPVLAAKDDHIMYVGTYTGPQSKGVYAWRFSSATGKLTEIGAVGETANPSFLAIHPNGKYLYTANETKEGMVTALAIDRNSGQLKVINSSSSKGSGPCYVSVDSTGKNVLVANYGGGSVAVLPIDPKDGKVEAASAHVEHQGKSVDPKRQTKAFAHCIKPSPDNRFALVADLGIDQLLVYRFDANAGTLNLLEAGKLKPGAGPRHFAFHPNKRMVYVINELNSTVTSFAWDNGNLYERQTISTLPEGFTATNYPAEIVVHPSGKWLYGSNRGHDSIAVFAIDKDGKLTAAGHTPTQGQSPRNFALDPSGKWLFAANQRSNNIVLFKVDGSSGKLTPDGQVLKATSPVCVRFL